MVFAVLIAVLSGSIATSVSNPAQAAGGTWVALGDSYSSGTGSPPYDADSKGFAPPASADGSNCQRASSAYAPFIFSQVNHGRWNKLVFAACRGAVTQDVITRQASALTADTTTVTLTIGGNDAGFASVMTKCLADITSGAPICNSGIDAANKYIALTLPQKLDDTYKVIRTFAPNATIYVLDYPQIYEETPSCGISLSLAIRKRLNTVARNLQTVIEGAVQRAGSGFVPVDIDPPFTGRRICSSDQAITDATSFGDAYHPNFSGHTIIASTLDEAFSR